MRRKKTRKPTVDKRWPVEDDPFSNFITIVAIIAERFDIRSDKMVSHHLDLLIESCQRKAFETEFPRKNQEIPSRMFIKIFNVKYLQMTDFEYPKKVTPTDRKSIDATVAKLAGLGSQVEEYLEWFFDVFLPDNEKFCPPAIGHVCSQLVLARYMYEYKDKFKHRRETDKNKLEVQDLVKRAKVLFKDGMTEVKEWLSAYDNGNITRPDLKDKIVKAEKGEYNG